VNSEPVHQRRYFNALVIIAGVLLVVVGVETVLVQGRGYGFVPLAWGVVGIASGWRSRIAPPGERTRVNGGWPQRELWGMPIRILLIAAGFGLASLYLLVIATIDFSYGNIGGGLFALVSAGCGFYLTTTAAIGPRRVRRRANRNGPSDTSEAR
jgi:hypothetical protein